MNYYERKRLAQELVRQDKYAEALEEYSILFKENPDDSENVEQFGFLFNRIIDGNYDFNPENAEQYLNRGLAKFYKGELENSIEDYDKAIALDPNHHWVLRNRALSLRLIGRFEEAITDLNKAIKIHPEGRYYDDLADIYMRLEDRETAFEYHEKAIKSSPNNEHLWYNYGVDLVQAGKLKEAVNKFDKAIELCPDYEDAIVSRQNILDYLGKGK